MGALNDRLLLANPTEVSPKQKKKIEIKTRLVGLLEPLLIGFATMQQYFEQKLDLPETLYQITSRYTWNHNVSFLCRLLLFSIHVLDGWIRILWLFLASNFVGGRAI